MITEREKKIDEAFAKLHKAQKNISNIFASNVRQAILDTKEALATLEEIEAMAGVKK